MSPFRQKQMNTKPVRSCFSWGCVSQDHLGCLQVGKISQAGKIVAEEIFAMTLLLGLALPVVNVPLSKVTVGKRHPLSTLPTGESNIII